MKGYKGFNKGLVCRGKQYEENTVAEEDEAVICRRGLHFCVNPFEVLNYYPLVNSEGEFNDFAEVEALDECYTDDGKKYCTRKLKIGAKLSFSDFINACVDFILKRTSDDGGSSGNDARIGSSGYGAQIGSSGNDARIGSSGYGAQIGSSGYGVQIGSSGNDARIGSSGYGAQIGSSGYGVQIGSSGNDARIGSSGNDARIGSSGYRAQIGSSGDRAQIGSSGDGTRIGSSGDYAQIKSEGENSVVCCAGHGCIASAKKGSWITLAEWNYSREKDRYVPTFVRTEYVDGERIKADTFYKLENGEFVETE